MGRIAITGLGIISPAGLEVESLLENYQSGKHRLGYHRDLNAWVGRIVEPIDDEFSTIQSAYPRLDPSVHYAIFAARKAVQSANWWAGDKDYGVLIGSSRGATTLWETAHGTWVETGKSSPRTSPTTTLGNISSWVGQDLGQMGFRSSHSVTCSTAAHALVQGVAWLRAGMAQRMLIGGAEAPLTAFTLAQMSALRIYSQSRSSSKWPCRPMAENSATGMILAEGAGIMAVEVSDDSKAKAFVIGIGYGQEILNSPTGIDPMGTGIALAMQMALDDAELDGVDLVVTHAPGTKKGDAAEWHALRTVFDDRMPRIANTKWLQGHGLGASAAWSISLGVAAMQSGSPLRTLPYLKSDGQIPDRPEKIETVLVNAMGFGGNCVSIVLGAPSWF